MQLSSKEYEFLGRQVADGRYVSRTVCILAVLLAFVVGAAGGAFFSGGSSPGEIRVPLGQQSGQSGPPGSSADTIPPQLFQAIMRFEDQAKQNPSDKAVWIQLGNAYYDARDFAKAVNAYNKALEIDPGMPDVLVDCGVAYRLTGQPETGIAYFDRALKINPKHEFALFNKGVVLHNDLKKDAEAMALWKHLADMSPGFKTPDGRLLSDLIKAHDSGK